MSDLEAFRFISRLRRLDHPRDCQRLFHDAIGRYGFDTFAMGELDLVDRGRSAFHIIDWPEDWRRFYVASGLIHHDPILDEISVRREPFTWSDLRRDRKFSKAGTQALKAIAAAGWTEGFVVPLRKSSKRIALVSLVGHRLCRDEAERAFLTIISLCLHSHVRTLLSRRGFALAPAGLTRRELACVKLVASGLSDGEIAAELGIARSTAHEYIENAKRRLNVRSRPHLAAIITALGMVDV